jgi:uncharacterized membrane protein YqaE (UPF0057 family)
MIVGQLLAALLLPPLSVFLQEGLSRNFWIDVGLTCLGFVPGIVFAFAVAANRRRAALHPG